MFDSTIPIWIISITLLVLALIFSWIGRLLPLTKHNIKALEKEEYLRSTEYIRDVSKIQTLHEMKSNKKLRHEK